MAEYSPNKKYQWSPSDKFEFTGEQFGRILNAFRATLSKPEAQEILRINEAHLEIEKVLAKAVEEGKAKEIE